MTNEHDILKKLEQLENELRETRRELNEAKRGEDYRQIMNAMAGHVHGYCSQTQERELERFWASERDDISLAHWDLAFCGRESVYNYYVAKNERTKAAAREKLKKFYDVDIPENETAGYRVMDMLTSPYIEIAADRRTAKGVWMVYSFRFRLGPNGEDTASVSLQRLAGEFVREHDGWKLWHCRDFGDISLDASLQPPFEPPVGQAPPPGPSYEQSLAMGCKTLGIEQPAREFRAWNCVKDEPALPGKYDSWDDTDSYINVIMDGYTNW